MGSAWVSQVQPWDENYERNIKGSKAKAFAKGLKEARQWLTARKPVFPSIQPPRQTTKIAAAKVRAKVPAAAATRSS